MFGGIPAVPTNSPHLQKSGSRPVVWDLGALVNSSDEPFLHSLESDEMKGVSTTLSSTAIMLSPTFLWRFKGTLVLVNKIFGVFGSKITSVEQNLNSWCKSWLFIRTAAVVHRGYLLQKLIVLLFFIWGFSCCKIGWDSVMRMSADLRDLFLYEAFLYYNPLLLVTLNFWLWGVNLWVFAQASVSYAKIFDLDQNHLIHKEIWKCAIWMTVIVPTSMTAYLYLYSHGEVSLAAFQPVCSCMLGSQWLWFFPSLLFVEDSMEDSVPHSRQVQDVFFCRGKILSTLSCAVCNYK